MSPDRAHDNAPHHRAGITAFRVQLWALVVVYTLAVFGGIYLMTRAQMLDSLEAQARSYFELVLTARQWNADHGGVWVFRDTTDEANEEYLEAAGIAHALSTESGEELVLRNPSEMTREISELTQLQSGVTFHLVGEDPINPANAPDEWESSVLAEFESGSRSASAIDRSSPVPVFRFMAPLTVDDSCMSCHADEEAYSVGGRHGGVSLDIPVAEHDNRLRRIGGVLLALAGLSIAGGIGVTDLLTTRLQTRLDEANERLRHIAVTDDLTGAPNRRSTLARLAEEFERAKRAARPLCVISLDLDHFKDVNDVHGHQVGDCALKEFVNRTVGSTRAYDIVGRVGGEEFLVVAPDTDMAAGERLAERILEAVRSAPLSGCSRSISLTASAGVAELCEQDSDHDALLIRCDQALYRAKRAGRDQVACDPGCPVTPAGE